MGNKLIEIENASATYGGRSEAVLRDVSLTVYSHDFLGVTGPNGGGKTTLLKIILGLLPLTSGSIRFFVQGVETPSIKMGYLPQINVIDKKFPISVREVVCSGLMSEKPLFKGFTREQNKRVDSVIRQMGLEELTGRAIGELSGGQLQRTLLGRAIIGRPELLILDEPGAYIDKAFEEHFYQLLKEIARESAVILVSHDLQAIQNLATRTIHIDRTIINNP